MRISQSVTCARPQLLPTVICHLPSSILASGHAALRWVTLAAMPFLCAPSSQAQVVFTNNATISETNASYDSQDIAISGATVTIDGPHSFNSLLLTNGAILTHSPCTATVTHKLDVTVTNAVVVSTNSRIDVSGLGYVAGRTKGNTTVGGATSDAGGSYGGLGGSSYSGGNSGTPNAAYGDYAAVEDWGSGGGSGTGEVLGEAGCGWWLGLCNWTGSCGPMRRTWEPDRVLVAGY